MGVRKKGYIFLDQVNEIEEDTIVYTILDKHSNFFACSGGDSFENFISVKKWGFHDLEEKVENIDGGNPPSCFCGLRRNARIGGSSCK